MSSVAPKAPHLASPSAGMLSPGCSCATVNRLSQIETPGPWCPSRVTDGAEAGGIGFAGGDRVDVDGSFMIGMAAAAGVVAASPCLLADADGPDDLDACCGHEGNGPSCHSDVETAGPDRIPDFLASESGSGRALGNRRPWTSRSH